MSFCAPSSLSINRTAWQEGQHHTISVGVKKEFFRTASTHVQTDFAFSPQVFDELVEQEKQSSTSAFVVEDGRALIRLTTGDCSLPQTALLGQLPPPWNPDMMRWMLLAWRVSWSMEKELSMSVVLFAPFRDMKMWPSFALNSKNLPLKFAFPSDAVTQRQKICFHPKQVCKQSEAPLMTTNNEPDLAALIKILCQRGPHVWHPHHCKSTCTQCARHFHRRQQDSIGWWLCILA